MSSGSVLIVGGGIHGCALARELALRGRSVRVLEKSVPGAEASSAAGGILGPHLEAENPGAFLELASYSLELYPRWVKDLEAESGIFLGFRRCGGLVIASDGVECQALEHRASELEGAGLPARWLNEEQLRARFPTLGAARCGLFLPNEAQIEPLPLMAALSQAAKRAGAVFTRDTVVGIEADRGRVSCEEVEYRADHIVIAAGAWSSTIAGVGL